MIINAVDFCKRKSGKYIEAQKCFDITENGIGIICIGNNSYAINVTDDRGIKEVITIYNVNNKWSAEKVISAIFCGCCSIA